MPGLTRKISLPAACILCSILMHLLPVAALRLLARYDLGAPVGQAPAVVADLALAPAAPSAAAKPQAKGRREGRAGFGHAPRDGAAVPDSPPSSEAGAVAPLAQAEEPSARPEPAGAADHAVRDPAAAPVGARPEVSPPQGSRQPGDADALQPRLKSSDFMTVQHEKLSYLISMHGVPIGSAELEAQNEKGLTSITLRVRSNPVISNIFPVNDVVETQHIDGMFIMTKIRQQEGSFRSDEMFTINLYKKRVSWVDFVQSRSLKMTVPTEEVLDTLSGIYYLRNLQLQVGKTETLHIYDSETFADVPVEILRREEVRLPNLSTVATLVVRPLQKTAGIFRRTGDILIWMTDDDHKVPVRIVTSIALGTITAELVSAESKPHDDQRQVPLASSRSVQ